MSYIVIALVVAAALSYGLGYSWRKGWFKEPSDSFDKGLCYALLVVASAFWVATIPLMCLFGLIMYLVRMGKKSD